jgi:hypothetical protein
MQRRCNRDDRTIGSVGSGTGAREEAIQNFRQRVEAREWSDGDVLDGFGELYGGSTD